MEKARILTLLDTAVVSSVVACSPTKRKSVLHGAHFVQPVDEKITGLRSVTTDMKIKEHTPRHNLKQRDPNLNLGTRRPPDVSSTDTIF